MVEKSSLGGGGHGGMRENRDGEEGEGVVDMVPCVISRSIRWDKIRLEHCETRIGIKD